MLAVDELSIFTPLQKPLLKNLSFTVPIGKTLGVVGESGAGKTMLSLALLRLLPQRMASRGEIFYRGMSLMGLSAKEMADMRGREIGYLTQHPLSAFDPIHAVGKQMIDTIRSHFPYTKKESRRLSITMLEKMAFHDPEKTIQQYPFELSGGMLQRVMIALMLILKPKLLIADEPTTALDTVTQQLVLKQLKRAADESMVFVTHDLGVLGKMADEVLVLQEGCAVEQLPVKDFFSNPQHSYTQKLLTSYQKFHEGNAQ